MVRKTLYLTVEQMKTIELLAERGRKSKSQVIRELIDLGGLQPAQPSTCLKEGRKW